MQPSFNELFNKYIQNACSPEEADQLMAMLAENGGGQAGEELLREQLLDGLEPTGYSDPVLRERLENRFALIQEHISAETPLPRVRRLQWTRVAAAAIFLVLLGGGFWYWRSNSSSPAIAVHDKNGIDIAPGGNKALLTLANGRTIVLDSAANGILGHEGAAGIRKKDGQLLYEAVAATETQPLLYNTLATPRGGQYQLTLPDGTKVWLNAASSIRYPAVFSGKERRVFVSGEVYFEVATAWLREGKERMPFVVEVKQASGKGEEVSVLGTHFNVNAYDDEPAIATTLLEGKVIVHPSDNNQPTTLSPGQQSQLAGNNEVRVIAHADLDQVMAWKNGLFRFDNVELKKILRQLARWYDVDIEYAPGAPLDELYNGEMQRSLRLSQVLKGLDGMGVHFRLEGRRFILLP